MKNHSENYSGLFLSLTEALNSFINEFNNHSPEKMATPEWSVKDILCHISHWHTYYSENYNSLASGEKPFVFKSKGGSKRNQDGVDKLKHKSAKELIDFIKSAHSSLYESIVIKKVPKMTYIEGREYNTEDFLELVSAHIRRHSLQVKKSK